MKSAIFYTRAYNAEKTLPRAIESVLNQTDQDFVYYVLDNASQDSTGEIIAKYAAQDSRIIPLKNEVNNVWKAGTAQFDFLENYPDDAFFAILDADDEYEPDFLRKSSTFMEEENLDIAVSGSYCIDAITGKYLEKKGAERKVILEGEMFSTDFPDYYQFLRAFWGKLYKNQIFRSIVVEYAKHIRVPKYGSDTFFCLKILSLANRIGVLPECLHKYYISPKSDSYRFTKGRIPSDRLLYDVGYHFLLKKVGVVSKANQDFLLAVYLFALRDTLQVLMNSQNSFQDKFAGAMDIYTSKQTQKLLESKTLLSEKEQFFRPMGQWVSAQANHFHGADTAALVKQIGLSIFKQQPIAADWTFQVLVYLKQEVSDSEIINEALKDAASSCALLVGTDENFLLFLSDIVLEILRGQMEQALEKIEEMLEQGAEIPNIYTEPLVTLGLNLSAQLSRNSDFIYFKKLQISVLIAFDKTAEAMKELGNWDELMPRDADFQNLRQALAAASAQK
jgi:glycosyltransferase involved in cell wall biosynthesis